MRPERRILVIDDVADDRRFVRRMLDRDYEHTNSVDEVESGEEGIARCRSERYDAVLLDQCLPRVSGLEVLRALRGLPGPFLPVLFLTASEDPATSRAALEAGALDYLVKGEITPTGLSRAITNATTRAHLIRDLERSVERFRSLVMATSEIVWTFQANQTFTLEAARPTWSDFTGEAPSEARWSWMDSVHPDDRDRAEADWYEAAAERRTYESEYRLRRQDGVYRRMLMRGVPVLEGDGTIREWIGVAIDVTESREAMERLVRSEEDLRRSRDLEKHLIGIVSHDLKGPLAVILMQANLSLRRSIDDESLAKAMSRIRSSAERGQRMIRDLLDFTQARRGGGLPVAPQRANLAALADAAVEEARSVFPGREIVVRHTTGGVGEWDPDRITQAIGNLLMNALDYSPPESRVHVRTEADAFWATVEVHNWGAPIPQELMPVLFEPMLRGPGRGEKVTRSVGLGLFIVDQIARAHGGRVEVRSSVEAGTTFALRLPRSAARMPGEQGERG